MSVSRKLRTSQPQQPVGVNWANPLTRGLIVAVVGGQRINAATGLSVIPSASPPRVVGAVGVADSFTAASSQWIDCGLLPNSSAISWGALFNTSAFNEFVITTRNASTAQGIEILIGSGGAAGVNNVRLGSSSGNTNTGSTTGQNDGKYHHITGAWDGTTLRGYSDSKTVLTPVSNSGTVSHSQGLWIANRNGTFLTGAVALTYLYTRALSQNEAFALQQNPWQLLTPARARVIVSLPAGGAGNSIAVPAASLTLTGYVPTVAATTNQTIVVPAGALALTGYAPTVVGSSNSIAVPAGALALTGYAPSIDQSYINTNVALATNGGTASASSTFSASSPAYAIDGVIGASNSSATWTDSTSGIFPDTWGVTFSGTQTIERVVVFSVQDGPSYTSTPSDTLTASANQLKDFTVQGWNGSSWDTLVTVTGNNLVKRAFNITPYTTTKLQVVITAVGTVYSIIDEFQAYSVNVSGSNSVAVPAGSLSLTGLVPTVAATANQAVAVPTGSLALTGQVPTVVASDLQAVAVPAGSLTLTGFVPTVSATANQAVAIPLATLALAAQVPVVTASNSHAVAVPLATLSLTGVAPVVAATANQVVPVPVAALALTGIAPVVVTTANQGVAVPLATLALTSYAPAIAVSGGQTVSVPVAALSLTAYVPVVSATAAQAIAVPAAALTLTTQTPAVFASNLQQVSVPAAALTLTAVAPDVSATANMEVDVPLTSLAMTALAPDVAASINISVDVPPASMTLTAYAPSVSFGGDQSVLVLVATLNMVAIAPDISFGVSGGGWSYKRKLRREEIEALQERERMLAKLYALEELPPVAAIADEADPETAPGFDAPTELPARQSMLTELRRLRATIAAGRVAVPGNQPTQAVTPHDNKVDVTVQVGDKTSPVASPDPRESLSARHARQREEEKLVEAAIEFYYSVAA